MAKKTRNKQVEAYRNAHQLSPSKQGERLLKCYDELRKASARHDSTTAIELVKLLETSLKPEHNPYLSWNLMKLYGLIRTAIQTEQFAEACRIADELYVMWEQGIAAHEQRLLQEKKRDYN